MVLITEPQPQRTDALTIDWSAPAQCPGEEDVQLRVAALVEGEPLRELSATGTIVRGDGQWTLILAFEGSEKILHSPSCSQLVDAAAVILSLALSPNSADPSTTEAPPPAEAPPKPATSEPTPTPAPTLRDQPQEPQQVLRGSSGLHLRVDAGVGFGVTPTLTTGRVAAGLWRTWGRVELAGTLWTPADAPDRRGSGHRLLVTMGTASIRGCTAPQVGAVSIPLCGAFSLGALRVGDQAPDARRVTHRLVPLVGSSVGVVWMFHHRVGLWAAAEADLLVRPDVEVQLLNASSSFSPGPASVRATLGIEVHFSSRIGAAAGNRQR